MNISLNEQEATVLLNLINIAVKAVGIEAAEAGLHFTKMLKESAAQEQAAKAASEPAQEAA